MKITCGGSMSYKKTGKPYENVDAMTFFSVEKEVSSDWTEEQTEALHAKVNEILVKESAKKFKVAYETYINVINKIGE
jgi:hypothetical protein